MKPKPSRPTHSQTLGIIWLSAGLILFAAIAFFSSHRTHQPVEQAAVSDSSPAFPPADNQHRTSFRNHRPSPSPRQPSSHSLKAPQSTDSIRHTTTPPPPTRQPLVVELNSADTLTLQLLHGIGPAFARRIVNYRNRLGGFHYTGQLLEVYGFTPDLLNHILPYLSLDTTSLRTLPVNSAPLKTLIRHPYIEYYQARDIVALRNNGVQFRSPDDLRAVPSIADSTLRRILPYIDFSAPHDSTASQ